MNNAQQKEFNQQCLYRALLHLLNQKSIDKITIGELCDAAGVSRMTFYRSYNYKEDILLQHLEECFETFLMKLRADEVHTHYSIALRFFQFWDAEERHFLEILVNSGLSAQLMERFYQYLNLMYQNLSWTQNVSPYVRSFIAGGVYKLLIDWIKDESQATPEEMAELLSMGGNAFLALSGK